MGAPTLGAQENARFEPRPVAGYRLRQTVQKVTLAVEPYDTPEKVKQAFGKADPFRFGLLPIFLLIANDSDRALRLENMRVQLITSDGQSADAVPGEDMLRTGPVKPPNLGGPKIPGIGRKQRKLKEQDWVIKAREFVAPAIAAGTKEYGFFYFRVAKTRLPGSKVYIRGLRDAQTGQELLYFEVNLDNR